MPVPIFHASLSETFAKVVVIDSRLDLTETGRNVNVCGNNEREGDVQL
mgnify:CR=1